MNVDVGKIYRDGDTAVTVESVSDDVVEYQVLKVANRAPLTNRLKTIDRDDFEERFEAGSTIGATVGGP